MEERVMGIVDREIQPSFRRMNRVGPLGEDIEKSLKSYMFAQFETLHR